ncbi:MAG: efflux RND transporter periplasmic adaptor subunit, partial [Bacteroidota bacterium]
RSNYNTNKAEVEASKQTVLASQYGVQSMEATLKEARKNLTRTEIFSPVNGIVSKLNIEKGERVVGTSQMAGTEMMRIANLNDMEVSVDVNENDIVKVSLNDTTLIEVDAYNNRKFKGIVTEVANSASTTAQTTSDQVTNFVVKIRILRSSYEDLLLRAGKKRAVFRPGMSASVDIQTAITSNVTSVPIEAVTIRSKSELDTTAHTSKKPQTKNGEAVSKKDEAEVVFILKDNKVSLRQVKTGIQDDKYIQITEGVSADEEIVTGPYSAISRTLKNGDEVTKVRKEELFEISKSGGSNE